MSQSSRDFKSHVSASSTTPAQKGVKRFELSTSTLGKSRSTIELHPHSNPYEIRTHVTSVKERYPGPLDEEVLFNKNLVFPDSRSDGERDLPVPARVNLATTDFGDRHSTGLSYAPT